MRKLTGIVIVAIIVSFLFSCSKSDNENTEGSFKWTYEGTTYTADIDTAFMTRYGSPTIVAGSGTAWLAMGRRIITSLTSFNAATYAFGAGSSNDFEYIDDGGFNLSGISGTLTITSSSTSAISGNFSVTLIDRFGSNKPITGTFTDLPVRD